MSEKKSLPKALKTGVLSIGEIRIPCAVLDDGTRILSEHGITTALGSRSGAAKRRKKTMQEGGAPLPVFLASSNVFGFIPDGLKAGLLYPMEYRDGTKISSGYPAVLLPEICNVWLKAREKNAINKQQIRKCQNAEILMRGLAHVGIISLVDEATGYQADRDKDELQKILSAYINPELLPWTQKFPDDFYRHMFRLWGWSYPPDGQKVGSPRGPRYAGKLTKKLVYEKLPPGVLQELEKINPADERWQRKTRHHQRLTTDIGNPHLEKQVAIVTTLFRISSNKRQFERNFARAFPDGPTQLDLFEEEGEVIDV